MTLVQSQNEHTWPHNIVGILSNPGVASYIPVQSHKFVEIDHEIVSMAILVPYADTRRVVVCYKRKHVHQVLVNHLVKLVQEKSVVR